MGFFSNLLSAAAPIVSGLLGVPPPAASTAVVPSVTRPGVTSVDPGIPGVGNLLGRPAVRTVGGVLQDPTQRANVFAQIGGVGQVGGPTVAGAIGNAAVFTRTVIQRISRADGTVLSETVKAGSPFLMNSEVRSLRRVSKMINKAHGKVPRRSVKVSEEMITDAVSTRLQQLNQAQCLVGHGKPC